MERTGGEGKGRRCYARGRGLKGRIQEDGGRYDGHCKEREIEVRREVGNKHGTESHSTALFKELRYISYSYHGQ